MTRHPKALIATLAALLAAGWAPAPASAGTYTAWSCRTPQGAPAAIGDARSGWRPSTSGDLGATAVNRCASDGYLLARLGNYSYPWRAGARWYFAAPANTLITAYELHWSGHAGGVKNTTSWVGDVKLWRSDQTDPTYVKRYYGGGAFGSSAPLADANRVAQSGLAVSSINTDAGCSPGFGPGASQCPSAGDGETSMFRIYRSRVTLSDSSAPNVGTVGGEALTRPVLRGSETVSVNATDTGSGVYRLIVNVDGADALAEVIDPDAGRCADVDPSNADALEFVQPQPCPLSASSEVAIDTTAIPEGERTLRLRVEDASGNRTTAWGPVTRTIDNVPPPQVHDPDGSGPQTGRPTIAGVAREGNTLVADPGHWTGEGIAYRYAWQRCDARGAACSAIAGATARTRTLTAADVGRRLRVVVTASNREGSTQATSLPTAVVLPAGCGSSCPPPAGGGTPGAGGALNGTGASPHARLTAAYEGERSLRLRYGKRVRITGRLVGPAGAPVAGAVVDVLERARGAADLRVVGTVTTASDGTFAYLVPVGTSRLLRFAYRHRAGASQYTHTTDVDLAIRARVALRASRRVRGSRPLRFRGRVPAALPGSLVLLQARVGDRWQVFKKARLRPGGGFRAKYVFRRTRVPTRFSFRASYPGRDRANLDPGRSRPVRVRYAP